ncbi:hypothetical protein COY95_03870 [Candidatus Woesearchaeota archaeon CG_4_10_14_0_8_um_filter_47_5]|nr:MAG: hypothetical protein COY95_03870 [Candidatus Woesearchaeota archaeon CG_4_10_14_0_8_um_filter_47_5]
MQFSEDSWRRLQDIIEDVFQRGNLFTLIIDNFIDDLMHYDYLKKVMEVYINLVYKKPEQGVPIGGFGFVPSSLGLTTEQCDDNPFFTLVTLDEFMEEEETLQRIADFYNFPHAIRISNTEEANRLGFCYRLNPDYFLEHLIRPVTLIFVLGSPDAIFGPLEGNGPSPNYMTYNGNLIGLN